MILSQVKGCCRCTAYKHPQDGDVPWRCFNKAKRRVPSLDTTCILSLSAMLQLCEVQVSLKARCVLWSDNRDHMWLDFVTSDLCLLLHTWTARGLFQGAGSLTGHSVSWRLSALRFLYEDTRMSVLTSDCVFMSECGSVCVFVSKLSLYSCSHRSWTLKYDL